MKALRHAVYCLVFAAALCAGSADVRAADGTPSADPAEIGTLIAAGKFAEAQNQLDRQLRARPQDPQLRLYKGVIQRETGHPADALTTFIRLSEDHPELPEPYNNAAVIYAAQGQYDKARVALEKALHTHASYAAAHDNLAEVYARLASQAYGKALQLDTQPQAAPKLALLRELKPGRAAPGTIVASATAAAPSAAPAAHQGPAAAPAQAPAPAPAPVAKPGPTQPVPAPTPSAGPTAVATAKPVATPAPAAKPVTNEPAREVEHAVRAWAQAWSERNMAQYLAAYEKTYTGGLASHAAWEEERRARIMGKSRISVSLSELQVEVTANRAVAKFRQNYKADRLSVQGRKTLELVKSGDRWVISKELTGG